MAYHFQNDNTFSLCQHSDFERSFIDTYTVYELAYARSLGYRIETIYEAFIYFEKNKILHEYMEFLAHCKLINKKVPSDKPEEIEEYVQSLNKSMNFTGKNIITAADLDPNPAQVAHTKGMMNQGYIFGVFFHW